MSPLSIETECCTSNLIKIHVGDNAGNGFLIDFGRVSINAPVFTAPLGIDKMICDWSCSVGKNVLN